MQQSEFSKSNSPSMSEDIRAIASDILRAKREFVATGLSGHNKHQGYKYAKIEDIYGAVETSLNKNNIIITHFARPADLKEYLYTRLIHTITGQWMEDCRLLESEKPGNQGKGAADTYMKKRAVLALCAIATEDDDGEAEQKYLEETITAQQLVYIQGEIKSASNATELYSSIMKSYNVKDLSQLKQVAFKKVITYITENRT